MIKKLWNKLTPVGKNIALGVMIGCLTLFSILGIELRKQVIIFLYNQIVAPEKPCFSVEIRNVKVEV